MPRMSTKRKNRLLYLFTLIISLSLILLPLSSSKAQPFTEDEMDELLLSPPGWGAMVLYPLGIQAKSILRALFLIYEGDNPSSRMGDMVERGVNQPIIENVQKENRERHLLPGLLADDKHADFLQQDLAKIIKAPVQQ